MSMRTDMDIMFENKERLRHEKPKQDAKDSTDCLASGRIEIRATAENLQDMKYAAMTLAEAAEDFNRARTGLEIAQEYYDVAQITLAEAQEAMKGYFA